MKFSVITPTHRDHAYMRPLYDSLRRQTHGDWEWVVWVNGSATLDHLEFLKGDPRVSVHRDDGRSSSVGYHKNRAFHLGRGDVLVEVDHDDILVETCLERLAQAYERFPEVGFVYSDNAKLGDFKPYNSNLGWTHGKTRFEGSELWVPRSFNATSHSVSLIWYAPDHVRSWRREVYRNIGGHNMDMRVLDDQDLMIRTYMATEFCHIPEPLYVYRLHGSNTWLERNAEIQRETRNIRNKWIRALAERDAKSKGLAMLDLGGGIDGLEGYIRMDMEGGDVDCDLNEGIPMPDDSCYVVNASHIIEHLRDPLKTMGEIHRVLAHGGWAFIEVPSTDGRGAFQDPTHVSFWNENSFFYYTRRDQARYIRNERIRFQSARLETGYPGEWWKTNQIPVVYAHLIALKSPSPRFPGLVEI